MIKYKILIYCTVIFFSSCNNSKQEPQKSDLENRWDKQDQLDSVNKKEANSLTKQIDAISSEDSTIKFTYQIQEKIKNENKPISVIGKIKDITLQDSNYTLKIYGKFASQNFFAEILVSKNQFQEISKQLNFKSGNEGCFIFKPTKIKSSSMLKIDSEVSTDDAAETVEEANTNASSELTYDFHHLLFFFKGNMVSFYLYKYLEDDED